MVSPLSGAFVAGMGTIIIAGVAHQVLNPRTRKKSRKRKKKRAKSRKRSTMGSRRRM